MCYEHVGGPWTDAIELAVVDVIQEGGGCMSLDDLALATADVVPPIKYTFREGSDRNDGVTLWEVSPYQLPQLTLVSALPTAKV